MYNILYTKLKFNIKLMEEGFLPKVKNSALRGGIGQMLLLDNCIRDKKCTSCNLSEKCAFSNLFCRKIKEDEGSRNNPTFIIYCDNYQTKFKKGEEISFEVTFFEDSIAYLPNFFTALENLGGFGLGNEQKQFTVEGIYNEFNDIVYKNGFRNNSKIIIKTIKDYIEERKYNLNAAKGIKFLTNFRVKSNGRYVNKLDNEILLKALVRRVEAIKSIKEISKTSSIESLNIQINNSNLIWCDEFQRYSSRQDSRMIFGGLKGEVYFTNINEITLDYLICCEILNIGKNTSFGLGKYIIF